MTVRAHRFLRPLVALLLLLACARPALAGGGPENLFLVVNSASWASVSVANQYIALRQIPPANVFYIDWTGGSDSVDGETFRNEILSPAISAMEKRGVFQQIDYVIYSSDFPYSVSLGKDYPSGTELSKFATPEASINSATYLWHMVMLKSPLVFELGVNQYLRNFLNLQQKFTRTVEYPSHGFRSWYGWSKDGEIRVGGGQPYFLSTMLAMTSGRGNSVAEALAYLNRSATADGTFPAGTIYYTRTDDVRSTSRQDEVAQAMIDLERLGVRSKLIRSAMPLQAGDVQGLISGVDKFSWPATGSTILPGAICDNFTSYGGVLKERASQTPLTEFLRYGAAGSAGTVVEPYSIAQKFASPNIFVHYARGCTLAESYYQSLFSPAQVVIVGDPLCRPWANIPQVTVEGVEPGANVSGVLTLKLSAQFPRSEREPNGTSDNKPAVERYELFVDGRRAGGAHPDEPLEWDSASECDGYHELRIVAIAAGPIETQGRVTIPITIDNLGRSAVLATRPDKTVRWGETLQVAARSAGAMQIHVLNNGRLLGTIQGEAGQIRVDPRTLGIGPVDLQAIAIDGRGALDRVTPPPVRLEVLPTVALPAQPRPASLLPGLLLRLPNGRLVPIQDTREDNWLSANGVDGNQPFVFQGMFNVKDEEVYQFQLWHYGELQLAVDDQVLYRGTDGKFVQRFAPVNLAPGFHTVTVSGRTGSKSDLRLLFGGPGATRIDGQRFQHPK